MIARCTAPVLVESWYRLYTADPTGGYGDPAGFAWWVSQVKVADTPAKVDGLELLFVKAARG